ncbi:hypothetical protein EVG20_g9165 [Dentipellis fragilis]|uniref:Uncharacterized protein n=1 Tax=Dentipellis fragilis TaxID=205917 RepID=A0A4Y9Y099_9AGAM|nr:hypothetical protein EVG20_g9165 [Dentipellis fragilis]
MACRCGDSSRLLLPYLPEIYNIPILHISGMFRAIRLAVNFAGPATDLDRRRAGDLGPLVPSVFIKPTNLLEMSSSAQYQHSGLGAPDLSHEHRLHAREQLINDAACKMRLVRIARFTPYTPIELPLIIGYRPVPSTHAPVACIASETGGIVDDRKFTERSEVVLRLHLRAKGLAYEALAIAEGE